MEGKEERGVRQLSSAAMVEQVARKRRWALQFAAESCFAHGGHLLVEHNQSSKQGSKPSAATQAPHALRT
jgi:hypothetical protein